jgi:hypothetical protein
MHIKPKEDDLDLGIKISPDLRKKAPMLQRSGVNIYNATLQTVGKRNTKKPKCDIKLSPGGRSPLLWV